MKKLFAILFMFPLLVACPAVEDIPDFNGAVNGTVMCKDQPVEGVEVILSPGGTSFVTKSDGTYFFENIVSGQYTLTFKKKGYKTVTKNVNISAGTNMLVDINMDIDGNLVSADTDILNFGRESKVMTFNIINQLDRLVSWEIRSDNVPEWVTFKSLYGDIPSNSQNSVSITVDRSKVKGEKDSFSLDIDLSTGNALSIKVNVEAGKVGRVIPELHDVGYDYAIIKFEMLENCVGFYAGVDNTNTRPVSDIKQYGVYYDDDENSIKFYCDMYPGQLHFLYIIPVNEYGQEGEMEVYEVPLKSSPEPEIVYTALEDITAPGTYNVQNAVVIYAEGNMCIIGDYDNALPFFYTYFDNTYTSSYPREGDVLNLTSEVISFHNVLEFLNPQYTVIGYKDIDDYDWTPELSAFFDNSIKNGTDMTTYCASSNPGIRNVDGLRGKVVKSGQYYDLVVEGTSIIGNLKAYDKTVFAAYDGKTVEVNGIAIGYNGVYMDILVEDMEETPIPTLESYKGYWNVTAYNYTKEAWETWENMYLDSSINESTGKEDVVFYGWMYGYGYDYFRSVGYYDDTTGDIILKGSWGGGSFIFGDDEENIYRAYFYPLYVQDSENIYFIQSSRIEEPTAVLRYSDDSYDTMVYMGDELYPDKYGRVANAFSFSYQNLNDSEDSGWFNVYMNVTFTRSTNPPAEPSYSRSRGGKPANCFELHHSDSFLKWKEGKVTDRFTRSL